VQKDVWYVTKKKDLPEESTCPAYNVTRISLLEAKLSFLARIITLKMQK